MSHRPLVVVIAIGVSIRWILERSVIPSIARMMQTKRSIWRAVESENTERIREYAANGGNLDKSSLLRGRTLLFHALTLSMRKSYEALLDCGANPETIYCSQCVIYYAAAKPDRPPGVLDMIAKMAPIGARIMIPWMPISNSA